MTPNKTHSANLRQGAVKTRAGRKEKGGELRPQPDEPFLDVIRRSTRVRPVRHRRPGDGSSLTAHRQRARPEALVSLRCGQQANDRQILFMVYPT